MSTSEQNPENASTAYVVTPTTTVRTKNKSTRTFTTSIQATSPPTPTFTSTTPLSGESGVFNELSITTSGLFSSITTPSPQNTNLHGNTTEVDVFAEKEIKNTTAAGSSGVNSEFPLIQIVAICFSYFVVSGCIVKIILYKQRPRRRQYPDLILDYSYDNIEQTDIVVNV